MSMHSVKGFTLIELMVSMVVASVLLAGLSTNFIMQSRVQNMQSHRTAASEDMQIAAQIMQRELRMATTLAVTGTDQIDYAPLDIVPDPTCGTGSYEAVGHFQYRDATTTPSAAWPSIFWKPQGNCTYQEMVRGLRELGANTIAHPFRNGFYVVLGPPYTVSMTSTYLNHEQEPQYASFTFKVFPRNE